MKKQIELKTLKDLDNSHINGNITAKRIRQEAIKWVKYYQKYDEETEEAAQWLRMWIIKFFNLTEEDLK